MITTEKIEKKVSRLEALKRLTLEKYLDEIEDLNSDILLYDVMFHHLVEGDFFEDYEFSSLEGTSKDEKKEIIEKVKKYSDLCFYDGQVDYWSDSIETVKNMDYEFISSELLDNYEFLIGLCKDSDEEVLEKLEKLKEEDGFNESSVIEYLRNNFKNDEVLAKTILNMSSRNSLFKVFSDKEKAILLKYPEGVLYFYDNDSIKMTSALYLALEICNRMGEDVSIRDREDVERAILDVTEKLRDADVVDFEEVVTDMSDDYLDNLDTFSRNGTDSMIVLSDDGTLSKKVWNKDKDKNRIK